MKKFCISAMIIPIMILLSLINITVSAQAPTEVYTSFSGGNSIHSGNGTTESPYSHFEDALAAVADGGTIYIGPQDSFINYSEDNAGEPFVITKNVTIAAAPGLGRTPAFYSRTSGIVLGADVTFRNVILEFPNGYRPIICANGYTLTMENVSYSNSTRVVHLAGGGMTGYSNIASGPRSQIIVTGKQSKFGNIYAGSINGSFDRDVDIKIEDVPGANLGIIYACGALEGYYYGDNFLDPYNEPEFPTENADSFPVNGSVSVELDNTGVRAVSGTTGGDRGTSVSISSEFLYSCTLGNVNALTVERGSFKPDYINDGADITIKNGATLDISDSNDLEVNNFYGGGTLLMDYYGLLTINGECEGETEFRTIGGGQYTSNLVQPEHMYIKTNSGNGTFTFNPYYTQTGMTFDKHNDGWHTSAEPELEEDVLTNFDFEKDIVFVSESEINSSGTEICIASEFTEKSPFQELAYIPFEYEISYKGKSFHTKSELYEEQYYEGYFGDLNMCLAPVASDSVYISKYSNTGNESGDISSGIYDIEMTAPTDKGMVTRLLRLVVFRNEEEKKDFVVTDTNGNIRVTYTNSKDSDIQAAQIFAAVYKNGIMRQVKISEEDVSVKAGENQTFRFNITDTDYDTVKLFIWDSILGMKPYACYIHTVDNVEE